MNAFAILKRMDDPQDFLEAFCSYENINEQACEELRSKYGKDLELTSGDVVGNKYVDKYYPKEEYPVGVRFNMLSTVNYARKLKVVDSLLEGQWVDEVMDADLEEAIETMTKVDVQFGVLRVGNLPKSEKLHALQQMTDEVLAKVKEGKFDVNRRAELDDLDLLEYAENFGPAYPMPEKVVFAEDVRLSEDMRMGPNIRENPDAKDQYPLIEDGEQVEKLLDRGRDKFTTKKADIARAYARGFEHVDGPWFRCLTIPAASDSRYDGEEDFQKLIGKTSSPDVPAKKSFTISVPLPVLRTYQLIKSAPGKSFYYHDKNRRAFFAHLKSCGVVAGAKQNYRDILDRAQGAQKPPNPADVVKPYSAGPARPPLTERIVDILRNRTTIKMLLEDEAVTPQMVNVFSDGKGKGTTSFEKKLGQSLRTVNTPDEFMGALQRNIKRKIRPEYLDDEGMSQLLVIAAANVISMFYVSRDDSIVKN